MSHLTLATREPYAELPAFAFDIGERVRVLCKCGEPVGFGVTVRRRRHRTIPTRYFVDVIGDAPRWLREDELEALT